MHTEFLLGNMERKDCLGYLGIGLDGKVILKLLLNKYENVDWIYVAQNRDQWWELVSMVMDLQVP
jgi:hypothetical protein